MSDNATPVSRPPQDERVLAALSHSTAILPFMGVVAPIVIWATQKDKSPYLRFQGLQAVAYQMLMIVAWFLGMGCYMCSFFGSFGGLFAIPASDPMATEIGPVAGVLATLPFLLPFVVFGVVIFGYFLFVVYGLVGAVLCLRGSDFRYVILGRRVETHLRQG